MWIRGSTIHFFGNFRQIAVVFLFLSRFSRVFHKLNGWKNQFGDLEKLTALRITFSIALSACGLGNPGRLASLIVLDVAWVRGSRAIPRWESDSAARAGINVAP